jgi:hypothetical protein
MTPEIAIYAALDRSIATLFAGCARFIDHD